MSQHQSRLLIFSTVMCALLMSIGLPDGSVVHAQSNNDRKEELESQIDSQSEKIEEINQEIDQYENQLENTQNRKNTLENTIASFNNSINELQNRITNTAAEMQSVRNRITSIETEITQTQHQLDNTKNSLSQAVQAMHMANAQTLAEALLSAGSLAEAWETSDRLAQIQTGLQTRIEKTRSLKRKLENKKAGAEKQRQELAKLQSELSSQRSQIDNQRQQKEQLLAQTNQQADEYQSLIEKKRAQKEKFEQQLQAYEQQLQSVVSDAAVPKANETSFDWPVGSINITQQFGGTAFAKRNPDAYGRPFHNGTDFGVPIGTPVKSVRAGQVRAVGNTDAINGCYSYGKWALIDHNNGLSTLYGHLSSIATEANQSVGADTVIGYSGNTGYSTGPHLHLTTYIQDDVEIRRLGDVKDQTNCGPAEIPVAPQAGYLNPMKYLP
jgi:murein DD-endopeptidase MepM/ murein hydrolase activator NlpD